MQKLTILEHNCLTENILKCLAQNRITTISEFVQEDTEKLSIISKLSLPQLMDIRNNILQKYSAPLITGSSLLQISSRTKKYLPTGIESLDAALVGGLPVGGITELCGLAGSGKTQFCFQMAIKCAKDMGKPVLYIDTKGDFSAVRVQRILDACGCNHKQMAEIMNKMKIVYIWTLEDAVQLLKKVKDKTIEDLGLIIIDSLPSLMFQHLGDDNQIGLIFLNELVNNIRFISKELEVAVVCVNIQTRWLDQDMSDLDVDDDEFAVTFKEAAFVEKRNRCLGKYWQHIPTVLLLMDKSESNTNENNSLNSTFQVQVIKSRYPKQSIDCILKFTASGFIGM